MKLSDLVVAHVVGALQTGEGIRSEPLWSAALRVRHLAWRYRLRHMDEHTLRVTAYRFLEESQLAPPESAVDLSRSELLDLMSLVVAAGQTDEVRRATGSESDPE